ncbi:hypothetical protein L2755_20205, partial [Shewanella abyssi]
MTSNAHQSKIHPDDTISLNITESYAMFPTAAVSGWYFAHPKSRYFGVTNLRRNQVEDYAERKGMEGMPNSVWNRIGPLGTAMTNSLHAKRLVRHPCLSFGSLITLLSFTRIWMVTAVSTLDYVKQE